MSKIFVDQVDPKTATTLTLGTTGDTVSIPTGVTLSGAGTITASAANLAASGAGGVTGTLPIANGGTGITAQALFSATKGTAQTGVGDNSWTKLTFGTELFDPDGVFDLANNKFIAPSDGKYLICYLVNAWAETANGGGMGMKLYKNGSSHAVSTYASVNGGSGADLGEESLGVTTILELSASDYIEVYAKFDVASGTITIDTPSSISGYKIGA